MTRSICLLLVLALSACHAPRLDVTRIPIAKGATFDLLPPSGLGLSVSLEQIVHARFGEREFSFHCLLEVDPQEVVLVGMTPMNTRAFTLTLRGKELSVDLAPGTQLPLEPARILADLQLALWPEPHVAGLEFSEELLAGDFTREFTRLGKPVIRVTYDKEAALAVTENFYEKTPKYWGKYLKFKHIERDYELNVRTLHAEMLTP
ncbi:MAG TPA: DUF3261 domain-containing protein [Planctomycetota bacterium]|nr:DUF3261 domain-containing protein [Planctomycetota bacterium]